MDNILLDAFTVSKSNSLFPMKTFHNSGNFNTLSCSWNETKNTVKRKNVTRNVESMKTSKPRKAFCQAAQKELENEFCLSPYLTAWKRQILAEELHLSERQVRVWFQNRRMRKKHEQRNVGQPNRTQHPVTNSFHQNNPILPVSHCVLEHSTPYSQTLVSQSEITHGNMNQSNCSEMNQPPSYTSPSPMVYPYTYPFANQTKCINSANQVRNWSTTTNDFTSFNTSSVNISHGFFIPLNQNEAHFIH